MYIQGNAVPSNIINGAVLFADDRGQSSNAAGVLHDMSDVPSIASDT